MYLCVIQIVINQLKHDKMKYITIALTLTLLTCANYKRSTFRHWVDADRDCQNTRQEVLIRQSLVPVLMDEKGCKVISGKWYDPFTDKFYSNPRRLDIDHHVPLKEAYSSGADKWDYETRKAFANDLETKGALIAIYLGTNRSKGAKDPGRWLPKNGKCKYIETWVRIKEKWGLKYDVQEKGVVASLAAQCNINLK